MPDHLDTRRSGEPWEVADYTTVIEGLADGGFVDDIATSLQRSSSAVRSRLAWLIPRDAELPTRTATAREQWLRDALTSSEGYDWWPVLQANYAARRTRLWTADDDAWLRAAWHEARPLPELVEHLHASEVEIARRLLWLGVADTTAAVVAQIGATAGGVVETRVRLATDRAASAIWVLVVDGLGQRIRPFDRARRHISIHPHHDAAADALAELLDQPYRRDEHIRYSIVERTLGEHVTGEDLHVTYDEGDD